ncbi:MAG: septum formation initiator family protein [Bacteroidetes bacterium]|nr:septum formation initiator family protein [Bacteroidota bacterium]
MKNKGNLIFVIIYLLLVTGLLGYLFFNDYGVLKYMQLKSEISIIQGDIQSTEKSIEELLIEIDSLKTSLNKIEKVARERHHMLKQNEQAFRIQEH